MAFVDINSCCIFHHLDDMREIGKIQSCRNVPGCQIQRQRADVYIAGALPVPEKRAFDTLRSRHDRKLGGCNRTSLVVVGMNADGCFIHIRVFFNEIGDHIGVMVRRAPLNGLREIRDKIIFGGGSPRFFDGFADLNHIIRIAVREFLWRKFISDFAFQTVFFQVAANQFRSFHRHFHRFFMCFPEYDLFMQVGSRNIEMKDRLFHSGERFHGAPDQRFPRLCQHGNAHIGRNFLLFDEIADKVEIVL